MPLPIGVYLPVWPTHKLLGLCCLCLYTYIHCSLELDKLSRRNTTAKNRCMMHKMKQITK